MTNKFFEDKIKPLLMYVGTIGAVIMSILYIVVVLVLIFGFKASSIIQTLTFAVVNAIVGLIIMTFLRIQGIDFAKNKEDNKKVLDEFNTKRVVKKSYSMSKYWATTFIKDALIKGLSVIATTTGIIYIVVEGSQDYSLLLLAIVNLGMFICFGFLAMTNSYDFFNEKYVPFLQEQLDLRNSNVDYKENNDARNKKEWHDDSEEKCSTTNPEE